MSEIFKSKPLVRVKMLKGADGANSKTSELINDSGFITEEEAITIVTQIIESGSVGDIDTGFVTTVKEQNHDIGLKFWLGTQAEYDALTEYKSDTYYIISDQDIIAEVTDMLATQKTDILAEVDEKIAAIDYNDQIAAINTQLTATTEQAEQNAADILKLRYHESGTYHRMYKGAGIITGGKQYLELTLPIDKVLPTNYTTTLDNVQIILRQDGNYLVGAANTPATVDGTVSITYQTALYMIVEIVFTNPITAAVNNDVVGVELYYDMVVTVPSEV